MSIKSRVQSKVVNVGTRSLYEVCHSGKDLLKRQVLSLKWNSEGVMDSEVTWVNEEQTDEILKYWNIKILEAMKQYNIEILKYWKQWNSVLNIFFKQKVEDERKQRKDLCGLVLAWFLGKLRQRTTKRLS